MGQSATEKYCHDVVAGKLVASVPVQQACRRHLNDLKKAKENKDYPYYFDVEAAEHIIMFAGLLKHYKGPKAGQDFEPRPWQEFILSSIFGWKKKSNDQRRYQYAYIEIARKNGKTFLAAVVALYMLCMDGEGGSEVYSAATTRDQAKLCWRDSVKFVEQDPGFLAIMRLRTLQLEHPSSSSIYVPLSSDAGTLDGLNPHCVICDELHAWKSRELYDIIEDAFGAREQPLMFMITTAGTNRKGICYEQRTHCMGILSGRPDFEDDSYFAFIASLDDGDDPHDEKVWLKSNPNLGVSKNLEYLKTQSIRAQRMPSKEITYLIKQMDVWTTVKTRWLNMQSWDEEDAQFTEKDLMGKHCYGGIDLSTNTDLTAVAYLFPPDQFENHDKFVILMRYFHPEENLQGRVDRDKVPYDKWVESGHITLTPGNVVDALFIQSQIQEDSKKFVIREIGYDPYKAIVLTQHLEHFGLIMTEVRQGHQTLGFPTSEFEKLVIEKRFAHGGNPVLRWNAENVVVVFDSNENMKPDKKNSTERIDGIAAVINALAIWCHYNIDFGEVKIL